MMTEEAAPATSRRTSRPPAAPCRCCWAAKGRAPSTTPSVVVWVLAILAIVAIWFPRGIVVLPFLALGCYPLMMGLWKNPLAAPTRIGAMGQICSVNVALGAFYAAALLLLVERQGICTRSGSPSRKRSGEKSFSSSSGVAGASSGTSPATAAICPMTARGLPEPGPAARLRPRPDRVSRGAGSASATSSGTCA